jgi:hypothetical protein
MPWFGWTKLQVLSVLTSLGLLGAHAITCFAAEESVLVTGSPRVDGGGQKRRGAMGALKDFPGVVRQIVRLPSFSIPRAYCSLAIRVG